MSPDRRRPASGRPAFRAVRAAARRLAAAAFGLALAGFLALAAAQDAPREAVRLGILSTIGELSSEEIFTPTVDLLKRALRREVRIQYFDLDTLAVAIERHELDFFIANAGFYTARQSQGTARLLATRKIREAKDPNESMGGIFFVRADSPLKTVEDLKGRAAAAVSSKAFGGYYVPLGELFARGYDPDRFFGSVHFVGYPMQEVFRAVADGRAEVGMARACLLEDLVGHRLVAPDAFRVVGAKDNLALECRSSTALYPDWVFAATADAEPELSRQASAALFSMPETLGMYWSVASDFTRIDRLLRDLRLEHYSYLREWTLSRFWDRYRWVFFAALALVAAVCIHSVLVGAEVRRKTASLQRAMREREAAQDKVLDTQRRLQSLERVSLVGVLSTMVAHELKQPLGAIANFADGIRTLARSGGNAELVEIAADEILSQTAKASAIIERVRGYNKTAAPSRHEVLALRALVQAAVRDLRYLSKRLPEITVDVPEGARVFADAVELSLVFLNLLKNAAQATGPIEKPRVSVAARESGAYWEVSVADNGPSVEIGRFANLFEPKQSDKPGGLGLGLAISARIVEGYGGRLEILPNTPTGLVARITLPQAQQTRKPHGPTGH